MPIWGYVPNNCPRCRSVGDENIITNFFHDVRCWSWKTAWFNLCERLFHPEEFFDD